MPRIQDGPGVTKTSIEEGELVPENDDTLSCVRDEYILFGHRTLKGSSQTKVEDIQGCV